MLNLFLLRLTILRLKKPPNQAKLPFCAHSVQDRKNSFANCGISPRNSSDNPLFIKVLRGYFLRGKSAKINPVAGNHNHAGASAKNRAFPNGRSNSAG